MATQTHLTTAALSNHTHSQYLTTQTNFVFSNSNGVTFGTNGSTITASVNTNYQAPGAYLTTAALSNHSHNFATTTTNGASIVVGTANSAGATIGVPAFLTTAQPVGAYLTTARASNDAIGLNTAATNVTWTVNSNGISLNAGAYLTTAAQTNVTTNNMATSERGNYFYTSNNTFANSTHSHGNVAFTGTNISASFTSASNGLSINLSAGAGGAGDGYNIIGVNGNTVGSANTIQFSNSNNVTFGLNGSTVTASASYPAQTAYVFSNSNGVSFGTNGSTVTATVKTDYLTTAMATSERGNYFYTSNNTFANNTHTHGNPTLALTNLSGTTASASNGLTISLSAAAPGGGAAKNQYWAVPNLFPGPMGLITNLTGTAVSNRVLLFPFQVEGNLTCQELMWYMSRAATGSDLFTVRHGIYSFNNSSQIGLISSVADAYSNTATAGNSGIRIWEGFPVASTLSQGDYVLAMHFSGAATASMNFSLMGYSTSNMSVAGIVHTGTNNTLTHLSHQLIPFWGRVSVTTSAMPSNIAMSAVEGLGTNAIPLYFYLGTHN